MIKSFMVNSTTYLLYNQRDFMEINGFDERIKPQMAEDVEFKKLLLKKGIEIVELDKNSVIHYGGKLTKEKYWLNQKNLIYWLLILLFIRKRSSLHDTLKENIIKENVLILRK
jgi:GT2 family glycosyltransferase